ncbi:MAG: restriction endonuclease subunit S [Desulfobacteraceae bacterium]|nr:restriction endonuclease subunit S [Desulfobacteraceae bacterium]
MNSRISDLAIEIKDVYMPNKEDDLPYIGLEHVKQGSLHLSSIGSSQEVESSKFRFKIGDILFGTLRPYFRKVIVAPCDGVCSTEFSVVRAFEPEDQKFIFYGIAQPQFIKYATTNSKGARPRTKWKLFSDFEFPQFLPSQRRDIASILSSYDDLIENNRRRIQLLEQAARLLYKEWFVHLRFPGYELVKIIDGVPKGWVKGTVADFGKCITGKTPSTKIPENFGGNILFVKTPDMHRSRIIIETEESLSDRGAATQHKKTLPVGTILVACIGAKLGVVSITTRPCQTNQQINAVIPYEDYMRHYILFALIDIKPRLEAMGGGATMPNVNKTKFTSIPVLIPSENLLKEFEVVVKTLFQQLELLEQQKSSLTNARDLLLPRLMNGEISV